MVLVFMCCSCADIQDAMPGLSYSDRTLSKGIKECAQVILKKSFLGLSDKGNDFKRDLSQRIEVHNPAFIKTLKRLKKYESFNEIFVKADDQIKLLFTQKYEVFVAMVNECLLPVEPEFLMSAGVDEISHYYSKAIGWEKVVKSNLEGDSVFIDLKTEFDDFLKLYNEIPYLDEKVEIDFLSTISDQISNSILTQMSYHEQQIRNNPSLRETDTLKKIFADYDPI